MDDLSGLTAVLRIAVPFLYGTVVAGCFVPVRWTGEGTQWWVKGARAAAVAAHAALWGALFYARRHFPLTTAFEGLLFCGLLLSIFILVFERRSLARAYGMFLWPVALLLVTVSSIFLTRGASLPRAMLSPNFVAHVVLLFGAYACFFFSFVIAIMYLLQHRNIRMRRAGALFHSLPSLEEMDRTVGRLDSTGLGLLILGLVTGYLWAEMVSGGGTRIPLKAGLSLLAMAAYLLEHVLRIGKGWQGKRACVLSVSGFALIMATLVVGRHGF